MKDNNGNPSIEKAVLTDAMRATLESCPQLRHELIEPCTKCEGYGLHTSSVNDLCDRCEGTGIKDHQDLLAP